LAAPRPSRTFADQPRTRHPLPRLRFGPGALVAAAFIGPGTVTTCTLAGLRTGPALLWALLVATVGTIVLQEMAARLGTLTGRGLGDALRTRARTPLARALIAALVVVAIGGGNAAYQAGNLVGASLGVGLLLPFTPALRVLVIAAVATLLLATGRTRVVERVLVALVVLMAIVFLATAVAVKPPLAPLLGGLLVPRIPDGQFLVALGLIGTTIVPYNLFLHAETAAERFTDGTPGDRLRAARTDAVVAIGLGGVVSMAVVCTAWASGLAVESPVAMAEQLTPLVGRAGTFVFALGLFAAGLTSAITAPLAAAYAVAGVAGWPRDLRDARLRAVWGGVMLAGVAVATLDLPALAAILVAQAANGVLLPVVALLLLLACNDRALLGERVNGPRANLAAGAVVCLALGLGARLLWRVLESVRAG
jgi:Mn2+/Fe2+ NRAMP family transporter